jgi:hypothetical protein
VSFQHFSVTTSPNRPLNCPIACEDADKSYRTASSCHPSGCRPCCTPSAAPWSAEFEYEYPGMRISCGVALADAPALCARQCDTDTVDDARLPVTEASVDVERKLCSIFIDTKLERVRARSILAATREPAPGTAWTDRVYRVRCTCARQYPRPSAAYRECGWDAGRVRHINTDGDGGAARRAGGGVVRAVPGRQ